MKSTDRKVLREFAWRVRQAVPGAAIWAFGARARGTGDRESDLDVLVIVPAVTPPVREAISELAWEVGFANDCLLISPILLSRHDFEDGPMSASTLVKNIRREGVAA